MVRLVRRHPGEKTNAQAGDFDLLTVSAVPVILRMSRRGNGGD
jgi:hypothetical protein